MPYATNGAVRIHYEVEGEGPPLLLHHGLAGCIEDWRDFGLAPVLRKSFRLIIVDGRGFGASDKPHDPGAYTVEARADDMVAVLNAEGLETAHFYGQSYGGWIGWCLAAHVPTRLRSLVITGSHPFGVSMQASRDLLTSQGGEGFIAYCDRVYGTSMTPARRQRLVANDFTALLALSQDRPALADRLRGLRVPLLLVSGKADPLHPRLVEADALFPHGNFLALAGLGHSESPVKNVEAIDILGCLVWHQYSRLQGCAAGPAETLQIGAPVEAGRAA